MSEDLKDHKQHFSEKGFWKKISQVSGGLTQKLVYLALLLFNMLTDPAVSIKTKGLILSALGYFILPFDAIPDMFATIGYADDMAVMLLLLKNLDDYLTPENRKKTLKTMENFGLIRKKEIQE